MGGDAGDTATLISFEFVPLEQAIIPKLKIVAKHTKKRRFILKLLALRLMGFITLSTKQLTDCYPANLH
jgi:hypothetical protein